MCVQEHTCERVCCRVETISVRAHSEISTHTPARSIPHLAMIPPPISLSHSLVPRHSLPHTSSILSRSILRSLPRSGVNPHSHTPHTPSPVGEMQLIWCWPRNEMYLQSISANESAFTHSESSCCHHYTGDINSSNAIHCRFNGHDHSWLRPQPLTQPQ